MHLFLDVVICSIKLSSVYFWFKKSFISLKARVMEGERETDRRREREIKREGRKSFYIISHSPNAYGRQGCSWLKSRAKNSVLVPHVGDMNPNTWAIISHLPGALEGSQVEVGIRIPPALWYGTQEAACPAATMPSPSVYFCEYKRPTLFVSTPNDIFFRLLPLPITKLKV